MVPTNNALYNAYIFDADYHLFMISDIKPSSNQKKKKKTTGMACHKYNWSGISLFPDGNNLI